MFVMLVWLACSGGDDSVGGGDSDADTDTDSDTDSDSDTDTDTDTDTDSDTDADAADWKGEYELPDDGIVLSGDRDDDSAGQGLAIADFDGDGNNDIAAASPERSVGASYALGIVSVARGPFTKDAELADAWQQIEGTVDSGWFGVNLASMPDIDGDGAAELVVAQPLNEAGSSFGSYGPSLVRIFVGLDGGELADTDADYTYTSEGKVDVVGWALDVGDVYGDAPADLILGAPYSDANGSDSGMVYVVSGSDLDVDLSDAPVRIYGDLGDSPIQNGFGSAISDLGDLDGDGNDDLAIGAMGAFTSSGRGAVQIFHGPLDGNLLASDADASIESNSNYFNLGLLHGSIAPAGDVDGDGTTDVLLGARTESSAYLIDGSSLDKGSVSLLLAEWKLEGATAKDALGYQVASTGDVDLDGHDDIAVAAPRDEDWGTWAGAAFFFHGPLSGTDGPSDQHASFHGSVFDQLGFVMPKPKDVSGDGPVDLVFGAPSVGGEGAGAVYIVPSLAL